MKRLPGCENQATTSPTARPPSSTPTRASVGCSVRKVKPSTPAAAASAASVTRTKSALLVTVSTFCVVMSFLLCDATFASRAPPSGPVDWQGQRESNPQPSVLETDALPVELYPYLTGRTPSGDGVPCQLPT